MKVRDVMTSKVRTIRSDDTILVAAEAMSKDRVGALPVANDDRLLGMLTDRDIVTRVIAEGKNPGEVHVDDVMSKGILYCFDHEECTHVAANMAEQCVLRLPVVDEDKRLVGIVSAGDLQSRAGEARANDWSETERTGNGRDRNAARTQRNEEGKYGGL